MMRPPRDRVLEVLILILGLIGIVFATARYQGQEQERCVTTGGRVVEVHGLYYGWICDR